MTVLVIEDDPNILEVVAEVLEDEGYPVAQATTGVIGLALLAELGSEIRLIVLDLMLPDISGWEVCRQIRSDPALRRIPTLILSAQPQLQQQTSQLELMAELEATCVLAKPFVLDTFLAVVAQLYQ